MRFRLQHMLTGDNAEQKTGVIAATAAAAPFNSLTPTRFPV